MKNLMIILSALMAIGTTACGGAMQNRFEISVQAPGCNNLMISLYRETGDSLVAIDSQKIEMQKARLSGQASTPELMYIFLESADDYLPIFVENGNIEVDLNLAKPSKSVITGSESNKIFTDFLQAYSVYNDKVAGYNRTAHAASVNNDSLMMQDLDSTRYSIQGELEEFQKTFVHRYIHHPMACYILGTHLMNSLQYNELKSIMDSIPEQNRGSRYYTQALGRLRELEECKNNPDRAAYERISAVLRGNNLPTMESKVHRAAIELMGTPYVAGTLDGGANEQLIVSLTQLDCVIFQEVCLALARDAASNTPGYSNFVNEIERIRYRNGKNTGYTSRLHYSGDWILDNVARGNAAIITPKLPQNGKTGAINFMSTHAQSYKALTERPPLIDSMAAIEQRLSQNPIEYIPKNMINQVADSIPTGSLIFIATKIPGLGYSHVGLALNEHGVLKLMHASSSLMEATTTKESLQDFLMRHSQTTGITVLKPL